MKCPFCNHGETKVIDKRESEEDSNRRRRECLSCGKRFTTYEKLELSSAKKADKIVKRDGRIADFDSSRIEDAIFKAAKAVGGSDRERAKKLADEVMEQVNKKFVGKKDLPTVEDIQDIVEKVLIENGHAKTAKAYIIYRQERAELRSEKRRILEKEDVDEVDKVFDLNALRVLKSRYLRKDENGKLIETPKQLFTRVAVHGALPDVLYDAQIFDITKTQQLHAHESFDPKANNEKFSIGKYKLNNYHLDAFKRMYDRFNKNREMKFSWSELLEKISKGELDSYEKNITEYYDIMVNRQFMPNTPAIANFGSVLGMGSACFHPDQLVLTKEGPKKISEIKLNEQVLTHKGRFRKVKEIFIRDATSLLSFECKKLPKPGMLVTDEHPILTFRNNELGWYPAYSIKEGDTVALSYPTETEDVKEIKVSDIVPDLKIENEICSYEYKGGKFNAFVHTTKSVKNIIKVDYDLMKLFGFYLSEGCVSENDCVRFTLSSDEKKYCEEIVSTMEKKFGVSARVETTNSSERNWLSIRFHSTILAKFFENLFGTGYDKKKIPSWMLLLPTEKQKGMMSGMIIGDGTVFKNWKKMNAKLVMSNTSLVYAFWQMCMRCGVFSSLGKETMPKLAKAQPIRCTLGTASGQLLMNELFGQTLQETVGEEKTITINGIVMTEVENIEKIPYEGLVYNLEVEEDHSYVANMISVHNCFVLGIEDSIDDIMEKLKHAAVIFKSGGGVGYNFSHLRPEGDLVSSTCGLASGPLSFMSMFDKMTEVIKQGGIRRGANMGIMNSNHPDIEKFITAKAGNKAFRNFNISVNILSDFWSYYEKNEPYPLRNPRDGTVVKTVNPRMLFDKIVYQAWESAEPGVIFSDKVNEHNPLYDSLGPIETTNPCVVADTLIPTENGLERIDSITTENIFVDARTVENQIVDQEPVLLQHGTLVKPLQVVKTGIKQVYRLTTKSGYELIATPDHKIMTERGWVPLSELTTGDKILIQSGEGNFREDADLPFSVQNKILGENGRTYNYNLPTKWTHQLGLVLGWLVGDGFISGKYNTVGFVFAPEDAEAKEKIQPILETYFNRKITERKYENNCVQLRSNSKHVVDFFLNIGYNPNEREVPSKLFTASKDAVLGFLSGLFSSDGTINLGTKSRNYIRLNSSSVKLLKQVQLLLLNLGVRTSIYNRSTKPKIFTYKTAKAKLVQYQTSGVNYELNVSKKNLEKFTKIVEFVQTKNKERVESLKNFEFYQETFTDKIQSKECVGEKEVWDITEPLTHSFIANGIIVHNCGEVLLYPNESCNLGSINVWAFIKEDVDGNVSFDWESLGQVVRLGERFLDNVIEVNKWPLGDIEQMALNTRKTGLGVMGVGDLLYEIGLPYNTDEGRNFMERLMEFVSFYSKVEAIELAKTRGSFLYYDKSFYAEGKLPFAAFYEKKSWRMDWNIILDGIQKYGMRNAFTTVIAPTGSISMIAGCSSGIEPVYSLVFEKNVKVGSFYYVNPIFEKVMRREGLFDEKLVEDVNTNKGTVRRVGYIPRKFKEIFTTAMDTTPEDHIRALAAFQRWVDSSISKTNNFPADATVDDMRESYLLAYKLGCKDVTVFRDTSIKDQVLVSGVKKSEKHTADTGLKPQLGKESSWRTEQPIAVTTSGSLSGGPVNFGEKPKICPSCGSETKREESCVTCPSCGWGLCS